MLIQAISSGNPASHHGSVPSTLKITIAAATTRISPAKPRMMPSYPATAALRHERQRGERLGDRAAAQWRGEPDTPRMGLREIGGRSRTAVVLVLVAFGVPTTDCPSHTKNIKGVCVAKDVVR
jgi:hypothetical protein